jgi:cysteine desulfurase
MAEDFGNPSSRTHVYGQRAKASVERARDQVAAAIDCDPTEVVFTSGATESNNLFIAGVESLGRRQERKHVVTTAIEHKSVLEPMQALARRGFDVTFLQPASSGAVSAEDVLRHVRDDTLLVSIMGANNETGVIQPFGEIAEGLIDRPTFFHVDAAQLFGKTPTRNVLTNVDFISISAHKIGGPKGVGASVFRRRKRHLGYLSPQLIGGGQERGMRGGTLPTPIIAGLGLAAELSSRYVNERHAQCTTYRQAVKSMLEGIGAQFNGDQTNSVPNIISVTLPDIDAEAAIVGLKDLVAVSTGSACTSEKQVESHVLTAMGLSREAISNTIRISWSHQTAIADWKEIRRRLENF